jgi:hypothetical protein
MFDPVAHSWTLGARLNGTLGLHSATALLDGTLLVLGLSPSSAATAYRFGIDTDSDLVLDFADNCPTVANPIQQNTDQFNANLGRAGADGLGDACDPDISGDGYGNVAEAALCKNLLVYCTTMRLTSMETAP